MPDLRDQLQEIFGLDDFRPAQRGVVEDVLAGRDVLCVMPTGAGKSLCYQLPAAIHSGLTIVISPLISLMEDQVQQLRDEGIPAALLNSSLPVGIQRQVITELQDGFAGLLYLAPERIFSPGFASLLRSLKPKLLAVDEAHCISQWGHDFRPEYARLGEARRLLGSPPTIALTATATEEVREDIIRQLELREPTIVVTGFDRPTLGYASRRIPKVDAKNAELSELLKREKGSAIVYCATRKNVEAVAEFLSDELPGRLVVPYHAGMDSGSRTGNQEKFMQGTGGVAVATCAFGMGINKPDIRLVVHYNIPGTLEAYYQEAGRAGRDGRPARCVILFSFQDRHTHEFLIGRMGQDNPGVDPETLEARKKYAREKLDEMIFYASTHRCRRQMILDYFGDVSPVNDCACDVCGKSLPAIDSTPAIVSDEVIVLAKQLLSGIARCNGKFGIGAVAEMLAGSQNERTEKWRFSELTTFGLLRQYPIKRIIAMLHQLIENGLARQRDPEGIRFRPVVELSTLGAEVMRGKTAPPGGLADLVPRRVFKTPEITVKSEPKSIDLDEDAERRFESLRQLRTRIARERSLPAYVICHDSTLRQIAADAPQSHSDLQRIKGMGPYKIKMYGDAFLGLLREG